MIRPSITAIFHGHDTATVYFTPPWWAFWRRPTDVAYRTPEYGGGMRWHWLDGSEVSDAVWLVLVDAYRAATRIGGAA